MLRVLKSAVGVCGFPEIVFCVNLNRNLTGQLGAYCKLTEPNWPLSRPACQQISRSLSCETKSAPSIVEWGGVNGLGNWCSSRSCVGGADQDGIRLSPFRLERRAHSGTFGPIRSGTHKGRSMKSLVLIAKPTKRGAHSARPTNLCIMLKRETCVRLNHTCVRIAHTSIRNLQAVLAGPQLLGAPPPKS